MLYKKYSPEEYPEYENYRTINIDKIAEISYNYNKRMKVPITFLDKFDPNQFEILGQMVTIKVNDYNFDYPYIK